jgi:hypothetical protein
MEDKLNFKENGGRPQFNDKWKTTSIFLLMEDISMCFQIKALFTFLLGNGGLAGPTASSELGTTHFQLV